MRQGNTKLRHDGHRESGAVCSVCQARSAVYIAVSDELYRIVCDLRTLGGNASGLRSGRSVICTALLSAALGAGTALSGAVLRIALTVRCCLLYTSDAADEEDSGDIGGRRLNKKKKNRVQK